MCVKHGFFWSNESSDVAKEIGDFRLPSVIGSEIRTLISGFWIFDAPTPIGVVGLQVLVLTRNPEID